MSRLLAWVLAVAGAWLSGCAYTAPYRRMPAAGSYPAERAVVLTLSEVEYKAGRRRAFFRDTKAVLATMSDQPGLLGYSFRFELLGRRAWTVTAWTDEASRDRFVRSPAHRAAMRNSDVTAERVRFFTLSVPAGELPLSCSRVRQLLESVPARAPGERR